MSGNVLSVHEVAPVNPNTLPDGEYDGHWGGYRAECVIHGSVYTFVTVEGIRTPRAPATITIRDGVINVVAKQA